MKVVVSDPMVSFNELKTFYEGFKGSAAYSMDRKIFSVNDILQQIELFEKKRFIGASKLMCVLTEGEPGVKYFEEEEEDDE